MTLTAVLNRLMELRSYYGKLKLNSVVESYSMSRDEYYIATVKLSISRTSYLITIYEKRMIVNERFADTWTETAGSKRLHGLLLNKKRNEAGELV